MFVTNKKFTTTIVAIAECLEAIRTTLQKTCRKNI